MMLNQPAPGNRFFSRPRWTPGYPSTTCEETAGFWPTSNDEYAKPMNDIPKVVFSKTLTVADWPDSTIAVVSWPSADSGWWTSTDEGGPADGHMQPLAGRPP